MRGIRALARRTDVLYSAIHRLVVIPTDQQEIEPEETRPEAGIVQCQQRL